MSSEVMEPNQGILSQSEIIRKNVSAMIEAQHDEAGTRTTLDRVSDWITEFSGSMIFVFLHVVWFGVWILLNVGLIHVPHVSEFDPFPFGLLTMIVSLEAIFLSTFVLISQNRMSRLNEQRAELDLHVNLLAEQKATKALDMLDQIIKQLNTLKDFNFEHDPEVEALKVSPEPQEVMSVMKEAIENQTEEAKRKIRKEVAEAVDEITGEMDAVKEEITGENEAIRTEVKSIGEKVEDISDDIQDIKERTGGKPRRGETSTK